MVTGVRQADHTEHGSQRKMESCSFNRMQQLALGGSFGKPELGQGAARDLEDHDQQTQPGHQPDDATTEGHHFVLEPHRVQFQDVQRYDRGVRLAQPTTGRGPWNAVPDPEIDVACRLHERAEAMVISALTAGDRGHAPMIARVGS